MDKAIVALFDSVSIILLCFVECRIAAISLYVVPLQSSLAKPQTPTDVGERVCVCVCGCMRHCVVCV